MDIIGLLTLILAAAVIVGGAIYWCGSINSKIDMIVSFLTLIKANQESDRKAIEDLEVRVQVLESNCPNHCTGKPKP